jgi:hypothetical protein
MSGMDTKIWAKAFAEADKAARRQAAQNAKAAERARKEAAKAQKEAVKAFERERVAAQRREREKEKERVKAEAKARKWGEKVRLDVRPRSQGRVAHA